jgi:hypothetical protein
LIPKNGKALKFARCLTTLGIHNELLLSAGNFSNKSSLPRQHFKYVV